MFNRLTMTSAAALGLAVLAGGASAVTVSGTAVRTNDRAISYIMTDLTYEDGSAYSLHDVLMLCLDLITVEPENGSIVKYMVGAAGEAFVGSAGAAGVAAAHYLVDQFYETFFVNGTDQTQWAFQYAVWELGNDYIGDVASINSDADLVRPGNEWYSIGAEFDAAIVDIYSLLQSDLVDLDNDYRSDRYTIDFFVSLDEGYQNMLAIIDNPPENPPVTPPVDPPSAVPLPASLPLVLGALGALGLVARKRRG